MDQGVAQGFRGEARPVRHEAVAAGDRGAVAVDHVDRGDRAGGGDIGGALETVRRHQLRHLLQVGEGDQGEAVRLQNPVELAERDRHLLGVEVLEAMRRRDRVDRLSGKGQHRHRGDDVGRDPRVDVEPQLAPAGAVESFVQLRRIVGAATDVKDSLHPPSRDVRILRHPHGLS